jgi:hypothetical protein
VRRAWDWKEKIAAKEKEAYDYKQKTAQECARAARWHQDFDMATRACHDYESAWVAVCRTVPAFQQKVRTLTAQVPCATVVAKFIAAAEAISRVCAAAGAEAESMASAWSIAYAHAEAFSQACADARAIAEAHAKAIAEAKAEAEAFSQACADAGAIAEAYAKAIAEAKARALAAAEAAARAVSMAESSARAAAIAAAQATAAIQATGLSLAFGTQLEQTLTALGAPVAGAIAAALAAAEAAAEAAAQAQAAALAAVEARAKAEALAVAVAEAYARAEAYAKAVAEVLARAEAEVDVLAEAYARARAYADAIAKAIATASAICGARARAIASAQAMTDLMLSLEGSISAIPSGDCPRQMCRLDPSPVTLCLKSTWIDKWEELKGVEISVNDSIYKTPVCIRLEMGDSVSLSASSSATGYIKKYVCEPEVGCYWETLEIPLKFTYWKCDESKIDSKNIVLTLKKDSTCEAFYTSK